MKRIRPLLVLVSVFTSVALVAQTLIINEVSNGPTGNMEYMELVVVSNAVSYNCSSPTPPCIDIRGWIIDDNSGYHGGTVGTGVAPGAVRFSNDGFWSCIPLGTIIVIYNNGDPNLSLPAQDISMADGNCLLVIPVNNPQLFETNITTPGAVACSYPTTGWTAGGNWNNIVLANSGDCMRIVDLAGCEVFSLCYGSANTNNLIYFAGSGADQVWYFNAGNPTVQSNWTAGCADPTTCGANLQTPGLPNNSLNAAYISQFNNSCQPITVLQATLANSTNTQCGCNGTASISASGSISPYTYQWYTSAGVNLGLSGSTVNSLCPGNYYVVTTSGIACTDTVLFTITGTSSNPSISGTLTACAGSTSQLIATGTPAPSNPWSSGNPGVATVNSIGLITAITTGTTLITYTDSQGCQTSVQFEVLGLPTATISGGGSFCFGEPINAISVDLTGSANWTLTYTFNGVTQSMSGITTTPVSLGTSPGAYVLTGVADGSCTSSAIGSQSILVNPSPTAAISGGGSYCQGEPINEIMVDITGTPNWTINYTLNGTAQTLTGITSSPVSLGITPGNYMLTGIADANCSISASGTQLIEVFQLPEANVNGGGSFCEGDPIVPISINLSGTLPWTINYSLDGQSNTLVVSSSPAELSNLGIYVFGTVTDSQCDSSIDTVMSIQVIPIPPAPITTNDTSYCFGEEIESMMVLSLTGMYTWYSDPELTNSIGTGVQQSPSGEIGTTNYYVVNNQSQCISDPAEISITITSCGLTIPTAFTPDGDGTNDWWEIPGIENYPAHVVSVYNRWGNLIYQSGTGNYFQAPWDGTYKDGPLPVASYYFMVDLDFTSENDEVLKGIVSIVLTE